MMYRITQSFLVNALAEQLANEGWSTLYVDFSDGRRGGSGTQGQINKCLETLFDEFPDILVTKNNVLLIIEVDIAFKKNYDEKLSRFFTRRNELLNCIHEGTGKMYIELITGLAFARMPSSETSSTHLWIFDKASQRFKKNK